MSEKMNENLKEKKSVIIAVLILVAIVIIGTTVGITQFKKQQATSGETTQTETQTQETETTEVSETEADAVVEKSDDVAEKKETKKEEKKKEDKKETAKEEAKTEAKKSDKSNEAKDAKKETAEENTVDFPDKKPAFLYFVSESDSDYEKAVKVFEELKKEYGEDVDFELKNVTQDPSLLENFAFVNGNTPTLIMDGKEGITGFQMKMTDKKTLEEEIKKALK